MSGRDGEASAGFTLVETVVAFAILALAVSGAVEIVGGGGRRARAEADRAIALAHAQSRLALLGATLELAPGLTKGSFGDGFEWRMTARARPGNATAQAVAPWDVLIEVARSPDPANKAALRTVLLAKPTGAP